MANDVLSKALLIRIAEQLRAGENPGTSHGEYVFLKDYPFPAEMSDKPKRFKVQDTPMITEGEPDELGGLVESGIIDERLEDLARRLAKMHDDAAKARAASGYDLSNPAYEKEYRWIEPTAAAEKPAEMVPLKIDPARWLAATLSPPAEKPVDIMAETRKMLK